VVVCKFTALATCCGGQMHCVEEECCCDWARCGVFVIFQEQKLLAITALRVLATVNRKERDDSLHCGIKSLIGRL
jgi:hypothetical protein